MDGKGYEKLMTFIIALYIAKKKKKKDAVCRINCALCSPTQKGRILGSFGHKVCKNIHQKIFIKNIHRDVFYYIGKKHHDYASNQAFELSQSLSHQIIIFDIKPMAPLSNQPQDKWNTSQNYQPYWKTRHYLPRNRRKS